MKKTALVAVVALAVLTSFALVSADIHAKPNKGIVVGTAIEISTFAMKGAGEENIEAMQKRTEEGFPVGILEDETGELWICVYRSAAPASPLETANEQMLDLVGKKVAAQGLKYHCLLYTSDAADE